MLHQNLPARAEITYEIDFSDASYANIYFWDNQEDDIIFFVSCKLRPNEGLLHVQANAHRGGQWLRPVQNKLPLHGDTDGRRFAVRIILTGDAACVEVDGTELLRCEGTYSDLDLCRNVELRGGVVGDTLTLPEPLQPVRRGVGELKTRGLFRLSGWGFVPAATNLVHRVTVAGLDEDLAHVSLPDPRHAAQMGASSDMIKVAAVLPGRVWLSTDDPEKLQIQLRCNEVLCGSPLSVSRKDVLAGIEALAANKTPETEIFEAVTAVEHVRFGGFWPELSAKGRAFIRNTVDTFGLHDFLPEVLEQSATDGASAPIVPVAPQSLMSQHAHAVVAAFGARVRAEPDLDQIALLSSLIEECLSSPDILERIFLSLATHFCATDQIEPFYAMAMQYGVARYEFDDKASNFEISARLPFLVMQGELAAVEQAVTLFAKRRKDWVNTPAIAWTIRHVTRNCARLSLASEGAAAYKLISSFLRFIDMHAASYWGRAHCEALIGATAMLIAKRFIFPEELQTQIISVSLRCYGLSRVFWQRIAEQAPENLPVDLRLGARAFAAIETQVETGGRDIEEELRFFAAWKCHDVPRFRLELLGPFSVQTDGTEDGETLLTRIQAARLDSKEAVVRGLAFPGTPHDDPALGEVAAHALRTMRDTLPRSSQYELQKRATAEALTLIARARKDPAITQKQANFSGFLEILAALEIGQSSGRGAHMGLGLGASTLCGLAEAGASDLVAPLAVYLSGLLNKARRIEEGTSLSESRYLMSVYPRLRAAAEQTGDPRMLALAGAFPERFVRLPALPTRDTLDPAVAAMWDASSPIFDTLVVIYSCKANIDSRVAEMRRGWLADLTALGIPYVVAVGDGDGSLHDDILQLPTPDNYENLPLKTVELVRWVSNNTPFGHVLKIDDDCLLNVEDYFLTLSYRKYQYYGRPLRRKIGDKKRDWHFEKSNSFRGKNELDKSPEPSNYADGGSGYSLSRAAMSMALSQLDTEAGASILLESFSEDKLIGDLLKKNKIYSGNEDYSVSIFRQAMPSGRPVIRFVNDFLPSGANYLKLVHLDNNVDYRPTNNFRKQNILLPKRLWPSMCPAKVGYASNALELLSDESKFIKIKDTPVAVGSVVRNELYILPRFLDHYRAQGVKAFFFIDNCSDDGTREFLIEQPDVIVFSVDTDYKLAQQGSEWKHALLSSFRVDKWTLIADADEFIVCSSDPGFGLIDLASEADAKGRDVVKTYMIDLYPECNLDSADFRNVEPFDICEYCDRFPLLQYSLGTGSLSSSTTNTSAVRHRLIKGSRPELFVSQKYAFVKYKPWIRFSGGNHYVTGAQIHDRAVIFAHFKYSAEFLKKAQAEIVRGQYFNNAEEYRKYLALLSEGRDVIHDPAVSVPWRESPTVQAILKTGKAVPERLYG